MSVVIVDDKEIPLVHIKEAWHKHGYPLTIEKYKLEVYFDYEDECLYFVNLADYAVSVENSMADCSYASGKDSYLKEDIIKLFSDRYINQPNCFLVDGIFLENADEDAIKNYSGNLETILVSFKCLEELGIFKDLKKGNLKYIDSTEESSINIPKKYHSNCKKALFSSSKSERDMLLAKLPKPPSKGYTLICRYDGCCWHKSGTVLLQVDKKYYLMGQDDGQYFGLELPKAAKNIEEAFDVLIPKEAKNCPRQGEWFAVPCKEPKDILLTFYSDNDTGKCLVLPKDDPMSNDHNVYANKAVIDKLGNIYAFDGHLSHNQHYDLNFEKIWVQFVKNTAIRSVSVDGVD